MSIIISIIGDATRPFLVLMCQQSFLKTATVTCFARHLADSQLSGPLIYHIHVIFSDINQTLNWPASFCHMNMTHLYPLSYPSGLIDSQTFEILENKNVKLFIIINPLVCDISLQFSLGQLKSYSY